MSGDGPDAQNAAFGALGQAKGLSAAVEGIARNPAASNDIRGNLILGLVLIESLVIYVLLISLILFFVQPFAVRLAFRPFSTSAVRSSVRRSFWVVSVEAYVGQSGDTGFLVECLAALRRQIGWFEARRAVPGGLRGPRGAGVPAPGAGRSQVAMNSRTRVRPLSTPDASMRCSTLCSWIRSGRSR